MSTCNICVPDLCTYFDPPAPGTCLAVKNTVLDVNKFYLVSDIIYQESRKILADTPNIIYTDINNWYIGNIVAYYVPFIIIILLILIVLTIQNILSLTVGILLMMVFIITTFISIVYIYINTTNLTNDLPQKLNDNIQQKYQENLPDIKCGIEKAILFPPESITCLTDP